MYSAFISPFVEHGFMVQALMITLILSVVTAPFGVFLMLRGMSLTGDAMSHALLPGVAIAYAITGYSVWSLALGAFGAGIAVVALSTMATRLTALREDTSLASFYLMSLALGVLIIAASGGTADLTHILFGNVLAADNALRQLTLMISSIALIGILIIYRPLVLDSLDPLYIRAVSWKGGVTHMIFMGLVVLVLVAGFQAIGTLMCVGLLVLPAAAARFWTRALLPMILISFVLACLSSYLGLLISYQFDLPPGPAIILVVAILYLISLLFGLVDGVILTRLRRKHFAG